MFDARTDLPPLLCDEQMNSMSLQEVMEYMCKRNVVERNDPAYERERIDELAEFIETHLLDELADQGCVEGFCLNARAGLERAFHKLEAFKESWCTAAARQIWYKYNH
ncbi:hypothetical protein GWQ44_04860 [Pseudomonas sp. 3MA1]|uniref:hypothetical protein n=1 Tax=Pseudomonas sp. 3MA1 TaxID=2699196 RepID=UPI0023DDD9EE|nr:hypothetical protein [Pseudomonas sp. 3MA1]MDF2394856.1 hypothetical protein [Pseudomonas sp. 3MA1]